MYSVLIQNQETMESFHQFLPIFMNAINEGRIGVCQWMEAGTTIETAVPEIYDLTSDKEEWRAVIVRIEDGACMAACPSRPENPYDFAVNADANLCTRENPVPLVRLTQMLGGVPAPVIHFECEQIREENQAPRVIYRPTVNEEDEKAYQELSKKYHFNGKMPSEIILVSLRIRRDIRGEGVRKAWQLNKEADSSEFWKRNGYPSACRFTFFEMDRQGSTQKTADLFGVWTAVMLLATNDIDPSTLQAYKLHRIAVDFDRQSMRDVMQETIGRVLSARQFIRKSIQREIDQKADEEVILPDYKLQAPVVLKLPPRSDIHVNENAFKLTAQTSTSDLEMWNDMKERAEKGVESITTCVRRSLDQTAERVRRYCNYTESEIFPLDRYQAEDLGTDLDRLYRKIFELRSELPCHDTADRRKMSELIKNVKDKLLKRVTTRQAVGGYAIAAAAFLLTLTPAIVFYQKYGWGSWWGIGLAAFAGLVIFAIAELLVLLLQKAELRAQLRQFNGFISGVMARISENASMFSKYMSGIASYIHGSSFLSLLRRKKFLRDEAQFYKQNHIAAINAFLVDLKEWSTAFHLPVSFEAAEIDESLTVDTDLLPRLNPLYTFETQASYSVPVNSAGDTIESPFSFIARLQIMREELYDDAS